MTVARAVKVHGRAGEISLDPILQDDLSWLAGTSVWFVPPAEQAVSFRVESVRRGPKGPLIALEGIGSREHASSLAGRAVLVERSAVPAKYLEEEPDPIGLVVRDEQRGHLGEVTEVIVTGANDVWIVHGGPLGEVLIPVIEDVVLDIDFESGEALVRLLPGLIDGGED